MRFRLVAADRIAKFAALLFRSLQSGRERCHSSILAQLSCGLQLILEPQMLGGSQA